MYVGRVCRRWARWWSGAWRQVRSLRIICIEGSVAALDSDKRPWRRRKSEEDGHELTETAHSPMTRGIAMPRGMCVVNVVMDVGR